MVIFAVNCRNMELYIQPANQGDKSSYRLQITNLQRVGQGRGGDRANETILVEWLGHHHTHTVTHFKQEPNIILMVQRSHYVVEII